MDGPTWHPAAVPDDTPVYVDGFGVTTAGELREPIASLPTDSERMEDATIRMWIWMTVYSPKAKPWKDGHIWHGGKQYPLSVFYDDRFIRLSKPRMPKEIFDGVDLYDKAAIDSALERWKKSVGRQ